MENFTEPDLKQNMNTTPNPLPLTRGTNLKPINRKNNRINVSVVTSADFF